MGCRCIIRPQEGQRGTGLDGGSFIKGSAVWESGSAASGAGDGSVGESSNCWRKAASRCRQPELRNSFVVFCNTSCPKALLKCATTASSLLAAARNSRLCVNYSALLLPTSLRIPAWTAELSQAPNQTPPIPQPSCVLRADGLCSGRPIRPGEQSPQGRCPA